MNFLRLPIRILYRSTMRLFFLLTTNKKNKNVLFICNGLIMAYSLEIVWKLLKDDERLRLNLLVATNAADSREEVIAYIKKNIPITRVLLRWAYVKPWDLIIMADHTMRDLVERQNCPAVYIGHGMESGKHLNGKFYSTSDRALNKDGSIRYKRIFTCSHYIRDIMIQNNPALSETVRVVGNMNFDKVKSLENQRAKIRHKMGFNDNDTVVFVISTWGPNCLWQSMGDKILPKLYELRNEFHFILSAHANDYRPTKSGDRIWGRYLDEQKRNGFIVRGLSEGWEDYIIACDIILSDHTSLAIYGALLGRPIVFIPFGEELLVKSSFIRRLRKISPVILKDCSNLRECLINASNTYPMDKLLKLNKDIISYPGQSQKLVKHELYSLLQLSAGQR